MFKQVSIFLENKNGSLNAAGQVLKNHGINIRTLSLADTQQFGILRLLVEDYETTAKLLEAAGFVVKLTDVAVLPVQDRVGGLAELLELCDRNQLSVEYMYAFTFGREGKAIMVFRFADPGHACEVLGKTGVKFVEPQELFG